MDFELVHETLQCRLVGTESGSVIQFRGIPYGIVPRRFAAPTPIQALPNPLLCKDYGPRCPQNGVDVRHLLRLPAGCEVRDEKEHEFNCLNLDVVCPKLRTTASLPVLIWIHGGSQVVTFASAASGVCDPTKIVEDSQVLGQPIIFVSINYRLNIFAFGDGSNPPNLALKDQRLAILWVQQHITGFGGDLERITIAGESAGAVYCHAHIVTGAPVQQAVLASGSLYLSPPQPEDRGKAMIKDLENSVMEATNLNLIDAPVEILLAALRQLRINTMWLQMDAELEEWPKKTGKVGKIVIGDVEYESVIWANGVRSVPEEKIVEAFKSSYSLSDNLKNLYGVALNRLSACHTGALDLLNDALFALPIERMQTDWTSLGHVVYRYVVDQPNPWQRSHRAHHAVDLLYLFGGFDMAFDSGAEKVSADMRAKWVSFINGNAPWGPTRTYAFGPYGRCGEINEAELSSRRRKHHLGFLKDYDPAELSSVVRSLAAGRISLLN